MKVLIVEDQSGPLWNLQRAVNEVVPRFYSDFEKDGADVAQSYWGARNFLDGTPYNIILLDHRIPYDDLGDLEDRDFHEFCQRLENIGYSLIPRIRGRCGSTTIIGTSSLSAEELHEFPKPDFTVKKIDENLPEQLSKILLELGGRQ